MENVEVAGEKIHFSYVQPCKGWGEDNIDESTSLNRY